MSPFVIAIDNDLALEHFKGLDPKSRQTRFCASISDEALVKLFLGITGNFFGIVDNGEPVAVLQIAAISDSVSEVAVSVWKKKQNRKYGESLMRFALTYAEIHNIKHLTLTGLSSNTAIKKIAQKLGFKLTNDFGEFNGIYTRG
jgi:RimJ/RimL family protein N-acetyltransferase